MQKILGSTKSEWNQITTQCYRIIVYILLIFQYSTLYRFSEYPLKHAISMQQAIIMSTQDRERERDTERETGREMDRQCLPERRGWGWGEEEQRQKWK